MMPRAIWAQERLKTRREKDDLLGHIEQGYGTTTIAVAGEQADQLPLGERWMSELSDDTALSALTIPGTHDSAAFANVFPFIQTQKMNIVQQLNAGIRYLDLRCGLRNDKLEMVHGDAVLGIKLHRVLEVLYLWLEQHPSEALICQIKQDRKSERSTVHFAAAIFQSLARTPQRWRTANTTPKLGELRGRIQLFRRFTEPIVSAYGIDVTPWQDNPTQPFTINTSNAIQLTVQDHYSFPDPEPLPSLIAIKGGDVSQLLDLAAADTDSGHWYINYTSAYEFNLYHQIPPREVAIGGWMGFRWEQGINPRLRAYLLNHKGKRRFGIIASDFPESGSDDLIPALIKTNMEHEPESKRRRLCRPEKALLMVYITAAAGLFLLILQLLIKVRYRSDPR